MGEEARNKATFVRFFEEASRGNLAAINDVFDEDVVYVVPGAEPMHGREAVKALLSAFRGAFPDLSIRVEEMAAERDYVAARVTPSGTNTGDFMGLGASGQCASWSATHFARFHDGRIVEDHVAFDQLALLQQLGFAPNTSTPA
jgi:steroid delta-isomerase-like uncharacterized protein